MGVEDTDKSGFRIVTEADLAEAVARQTGLEDAPGFTPVSHRHAAENLAAVLETLLVYVDRGWQLVQYELSWEPAWYREVTGAELPEPPAGWLPIEAAAGMKGVAVRTVKETAPRHLTAMRCAGHAWYVAADDKFDRWLSTIPDWGALSLRLRAVVAAAQGLVTAGRGSAATETVYRLAEAAEESSGGVFGYHKRHGIARFIERHLLDPEVSPGKEPVVLPQSASEWVSRGGAIVASVSALARLQVEAAHRQNAGEECTS